MKASGDTFEQKGRKEKKVATDDASGIETKQSDIYCTNSQGKELLDGWMDVVKEARRNSYVHEQRECVDNVVDG
jgi:hypothetical protein